MLPTPYHFPSSVFSENIRKTTLSLHSISWRPVSYTHLDVYKRQMWDGEFTLMSDQGRPFAVPGIGIANYLGMRINFITPLNIYVPKRTGKVDLDPENAFIRN